MGGKKETKIKLKFSIFKNKVIKGNGNETERKVKPLNFKTLL